MTQQSKGFTLIELLIVIGILAVLATATVIVLNPGQILAQSRDAKRVADIGSLDAALSLYSSQFSGTYSLGSGTAGGRCTANPGANNGPFATTTCAVVSTSKAVNGTGWVDVDFTNLQTGVSSPLSVLPLDPTNNTTYYYAYRGVTSTSTWELNYRLESIRNRDQMTTDGGDKNTCGTDYGAGATAATCFMEQGNDPGLDL